MFTWKNNSFENLPMQSLISEALKASCESEQLLKNLIVDGLAESCPIKLDSHNINLDSDTEAFNRAISRCELGKSLFQVTKGWNGDISNVSECISVKEDTNTDTISMDDVLEFAMNLHNESFISDQLMNRYNAQLMESLREDLKDIIIDGVETDVNSSIKSGTIPQSFTLCTESMANEDFLNSMINSLGEVDSGSNANLNLSLDELDTLINDFIADEKFMTSTGSTRLVLQTLSHFLRAMYQELTNLADKLITVNQYRINIYETILFNFRSSYVRHATKLLHYGAFISQIIFSKLIDCLEKDSDETLNIQGLKNLLTDFTHDILDYHNHNLYYTWGESEEVYQEAYMSGIIYLNNALKTLGLKVTESEELYGDKYETTSYLFDSTESSSLMKEMNPTELIDTLTESFEVLKDGTIKVTVSSKSTYMDEYATNHRLLLANRKVGDYEAMRYNLVYHLILIDNIEKNVMHNKKVDKSSPLYEDAMKARSFAKNDISTYLPEVKRHVKDFDINKFYRQVDAEKSTITINGVDTATGVKKIIKAIVM